MSKEYFQRAADYTIELLADKRKAATSKMHEINRKISEDFPDLLNDSAILSYHFRTEEYPILIDIDISDREERQHYILMASGYPTKVPVPNKYREDFDEVVPYYKEYSKLKRTVMKAIRVLKVVDSSHESLDSVFYAVSNTQPLSLKGIESELSTHQLKIFRKGMEIIDEYSALKIIGVS